MSLQAKTIWAAVFAGGVFLFATSPDLPAQVILCGAVDLSRIPIQSSASCIDIPMMRDNNSVDVGISVLNLTNSDVFLTFRTAGQTDFLVMDEDGNRGDRTRDLRDVRVRRNDSAPVTIRVISFSPGQINAPVNVSWEGETEKLLDISATVIETPAPSAPDISIEFVPIFDGDSLEDTIAHVSWGASTDPDLDGRFAGEDRDGVTVYHVTWEYFSFPDSASSCGDLPAPGDPFWNQPDGTGSEVIDHVDGRATFSLRDLSAFADGFVDPRAHALRVRVGAFDGDMKTTASIKTACIVVDMPKPKPVFPDRGDVDNSGDINLTDPIFLLNHLFDGGPAPECEAAADVDASGSLNISDAVQLLAFLFNGIPLPPTEEITSCDL